MATEVAKEFTKLDQALARVARMLASNPKNAEEHLRDIERDHPGHPQVLLHLSRALRAQQKTRRAVDLLHDAIARHPKLAPLHYELALVYCDRGEKAKAVAGFRHALGLDPNIANGWLVLGDLLYELGDRKAADEAYMSHVVVSGNAPHIREAMAALRDGKFAAAEDILRRHLITLPTDVATIAVLGEALGRQGEQDEAAYLLGRCVARVPSFEKARFNYATTLCRLQRAEEAIAQVDILLAANPNELTYRGLRANAITINGNSAEAIHAYERLLEDYPEDHKSWTAYGHALRAGGRLADAVTAYQRSATLNPAYGDAYWGIANLKTVKFGDDEIAALRARLAKGDLSSGDRRYFCFALGKALEDRGDYADSFVYYAEANALRRAELPYDPDETTRQLRLIQSCVSRGVIESLAGQGSSRPDPIFIVGLPRAGSTLIEQILDCHSQVEGTAELPDLKDIVRSLDGNPWERRIIAYPEELARLGPGDFHRLGEDYIARTRRTRKSAKPLFTDKMPSNFEHIGLIQLILPNAKIIDARRHPLGCCLSNFKQFYSNGQRFTYDLTSLGRYYADYVALMAHYDEVLPGRVHRVFHEKMVESPEREIRALLEYCGLAFEPACLKFHENPRQVRTVSSEQVRRPIFADGVDQWRKYEPWLGPLKGALGAVLDAYPNVPRQNR